MQNCAVAKLKMQFVAGPQNYTFHACEDHRWELAAGRAAEGIFYRVKGWGVETVDPEDEVECDLCREG